MEVDSPVDEDILVPNAARVAEKSDDEEEDEEEPDDEDVEASLDVILKERLVVEDEPDDEEITDVEDRSEISERVLPKQPDEFVCSSCFLVKHPSQLADKKKMLCREPCLILPPPPTARRRPTTTLASPAATLTPSTCWSSPRPGWW